MQTYTHQCTHAHSHTHDFATQLTSNIFVYVSLSYISSASWACICIALGFLSRSIRFYCCRFACVLCVWNVFKQVWWYTDVYKQCQYWYKQSIISETTKVFAFPFAWKYVFVNESGQLTHQIRNTEIQPPENEKFSRPKVHTRGLAHKNQQKIHNTDFILASRWWLLFFIFTRFFVGSKKMNWRCSLLHWERITLSTKQNNTKKHKVN